MIGGGDFFRICVTSKSWGKDIINNFTRFAALFLGNVWVWWSSTQLHRLAFRMNSKYSPKQTHLSKTSRTGSTVHGPLQKNWVSNSLIATYLVRSVGKGPLANFWMEPYPTPWFCPSTFRGGWLVENHSYKLPGRWPLSVVFRNPPSTWRIIPASKWLVTPIYKPFRPFIRGTTSLRGLTNHGY